jgi:hypothetical protein
MEHQPLLRSLEYSILHSEDLNSGQYFHQREDRGAATFPLVNFRIDFEHGNFFLEGSWMFMMASNKKVRQMSSLIKVESINIFP